jgi:general secretion pathway protein K
VTGSPNHRERGFALLIVLWSMVLLSLLVTRLISSGRSEANIAFNLRSAAQLQAQADGLVALGIFNALRSNTGAWKPDGVVYRQSLTQNAVGQVKMIDLGGRVNPNTASAPMLAALLLQVGATTQQATTVSQAILAWRSPDVQGAYELPQYKAANLPYGPAGSLFQSLGEVKLVFGMTPTLFSKLAPHLSLYNTDNPEPRLADELTRRALQEADRATPDQLRPPRDIHVTAEADAAGNRRAIREADVELRISSSRLGFRILSWTP